MLLLLHIKLWRKFSFLIVAEILFLIVAEIYKYSIIVAEFSFLIVAEI